MDEYHPDRDALECFARGEIFAETERWIVNHLRSGCPICQRTIDALLPCPEATPAHDPHGSNSSHGALGSNRSLGSDRSFGSDRALGSNAAGKPVQPFQGANETDSTRSIRPRHPAGRFSGSPASLLSPWASSLPPRQRGSLAPLAPLASMRRQPRREPDCQAALASGSAGSWGGDPALASGSASGWGGHSLSTSAGAPHDPPEDMDVENEAWDRIFAKLEQRLVLVAAERAAAPRLLADLLQRPAAEWSALVHASRHFQSLALCDLLLDRSFEAGSHDSSEATALAQLGIMVADHLDVRHYGPAVVHDMKARAWAYLGNSRRISADFAGAEQALAFAESLSEDGSADPLEEARLLDLKALLLSDQGWFEEAAELLDSVIEIYEDVKDLHRKGRALIAKGLCLGRAGWPQVAVDLIQQGLAQLDREIEPLLALTAGHELAWFLEGCGRCNHAQRQLDRVRQELLDGEDPRAELRMEWLLARIARRSGRWQEAEHSLGSLLQRFVAGGHGYETALVMLDLAGLHLDQGRCCEIRRLAAEVLPVVLSMDIHRQAAAALVTFQQAAQGDRVTPALVGDIAAYLQRARKNPRLSFQLPA